MSLLLPSACACVRTVLPICNGPSLSAAKAAPPVIVIAGGFGAVLPCHHASTQDGVSQLLVYLNRRSRASHQDPVTASAAMRTAGGREVGTLCPLGRGGGLCLAALVVVMVLAVLKDLVSRCVCRLSRSLSSRLRCCLMSSKSCTGICRGSR